MEALKALFPSPGRLAWHCFPLMLTLTHRRVFSHRSMTLPSGSPWSGTNMRSVSRRRAWSIRCPIPLRLVSSSSDTMNRDMSWIGSMFRSFKAIRAKIEAVNAWPLSSTPLPINLPPSLLSLKGSPVQLPRSPGGTTSMCVMTTNLLDGSLPLTLISILGRDPPGTDGSTAS